VRHRVNEITSFRHQVEDVLPWKLTEEAMKFIIDWRDSKSEIKLDEKETPECERTLRFIGLPFVNGIHNNLEEHLIKYFEAVGPFTVSCVAFPHPSRACEAVVTFAGVPIMLKSYSTKATLR
jgi:hypothetical protein